MPHRLPVCSLSAQRGGGGDHREPSDLPKSTCANKEGETQAARIYRIRPPTRAPTCQPSRLALVYSLSRDPSSRQYQSPCQPSGPTLVLALVYSLRWPPLSSCPLLRAANASLSSRFGNQ